ncbi:MAG: polysaccharide deacetylase family protein [Clostridia bacterium]|nr:polysaccharide deacetylase family protein [Clostridia bacterium]
MRKSQKKKRYRGLTKRCLSVIGQTVLVFLFISFVMPIGTISPEGSGQREISLKDQVPGEPAQELPAKLPEKDGSAAGAEAAEPEKNSGASEAGEKANEKEQPVVETETPVPGNNTGDSDSAVEGKENSPQDNGGVFRGNPQQGKKVALTFDDGPYPIWTAEYLKVLQEYQAQATFFLVGQRVEWYPELAQKIISFGCEVGSHSYQHGRLKEFAEEELVQDFQKTADVINEIIGQELELFRPPYGGYNPSVVEVAQSFGQTPVNWNVDPRDWDTTDAQKVANRVISQVTDGAVVVMHEGRESTLKAIPHIINGLRARGFELVTVSELMDETLIDQSI